jgi:hypothetical protein
MLLTSTVRTLEGADTTSNLALDPLLNIPATRVRLPQRGDANLSRRERLRLRSEIRGGEHTPNRSEPPESR